MTIAAPLATYVFRPKTKVTWSYKPIVGNGAPPLPLVEVGFNITTGLEGGQGATKLLPFGSAPFAAKYSIVPDAGEAPMFLFTQEWRLPQTQVLGGGITVSASPTAITRPFDGYTLGAIAALSQGGHVPAVTLETKRPVHLTPLFWIDLTDVVLTSVRISGLTETTDLVFGEIGWHHQGPTKGDGTNPPPTGGSWNLAPGGSN